MKATTNRTPENLTWKSICERYPIATVKVDGKQVMVNSLKDAIEDGTLLAEVTEAANEMYEGDTYQVLSAMSRVLSSALVNIRKRADSPTKTKDLSRCEMLREFVSKNMAAIKAARPIEQQAKWRYSKEDIEAIPLSEVKQLKSIRDCMASKLSDYPDDLPATFHAAYGAACERYSAAAKAAKVSKPSLDDSGEKLLAALKTGGKLTKADKAKLAALLESLTK